jgi:hypothetical protein
LKVPNALLLLFLVVLSSIPAGFAQATATRVDTITVRTVPLTIKVVLIGFDQQTIDQDYLTWKGNSVKDSVNNVLSTGNITGISYDLAYQFVYSRPSFQDGLVKFLKSIEQRKLLYNPWFKSITANYFYDAEKVENWFIANNASYGGMPSDGYTFVFANLTALPSVTESQLESENPSMATPHYYGTQFADKDLDYAIRYREFSVGWGGRSRLWYLDLAAGPEFWTWTNSEATPHVPMQLAIDLYKLNVHSPYGKQWLTQFISDYIYDAVLNLAVPAFTYQPVYSRTYRIVLNIIDNRTVNERDAVPIETTIHPELVKRAFTDLLPYADVRVETHFISAEKMPDLQAKMIANTVTPPSDLGIGPYLDTRPLYRYLQEHLSEFTGVVRRDSTEFTLPVFAFAFPAGIYFGYTYKWYVSTLKLDEGGFLGISLGDMALVGLSQDEFRKGDNVNPPQPGKGIGFTQAVIHEAGHSLGLMHPHQFGYLEDFESSAMSYWSWEYTFSQFDKDSINRGHADQLINSALSKLTQAQDVLETRFDLGLVGNQLASSRSLLDRALEKYGSMQYVLAVETAWRADQSATSALAAVLSEPGFTVSILISLLLGIVIGSLLIFVALTQYAKKATERR